MTLKRLYSDNIGKKNIVGSVVYENYSNKSSWESIEIYFRGTQKSERKIEKKNKYHRISYDLL